MDARIVFTFSSSWEEIELAEICTRAVCNRVIPDHATCGLIENAVAEALNNVVEHAYENRSDGKIELQIAFIQDELMIEVADNGKQNISSEIRQLDFDPENIGSIPEGGMGMVIIHRIMDTVKYTSTQGINRLIMVKKIKKE